MSAVFYAPLAQHASHGSHGFAAKRHHWTKRPGRV